MAFEPNIGFGSGVLWATPAGANATPIRFGILQGVDIDFQYTEKELFGEYQLPVLVARGTSKITGKAKVGRFDSALVNKLFFDVTATAGATLYAVDEGPTAIPTTPFQVTVANSATWTQDLGVQFANGVNAGQFLTRVASGPITGQYSCAAGVYTFASADNVSGYMVKISYRYTQASAGFSGVIGNKLLGDATACSIDLYQKKPNSSQQWGLRLYAALLTGMSMSLKLEDFTIPEFSFKVYVDGNNNLGEFNLPN